MKRRLISLHTTLTTAIFHLRACCAAGKPSADPATPVRGGRAQTARPLYGPREADFRASKHFVSGRSFPKSDPLNADYTYASTTYLGMVLALCAADSSVLPCAHGIYATMQRARQHPCDRCSSASKQRSLQQPQVSIQQCPLPAADGVPAACVTSAGPPTPAPCTRAFARSLTASILASWQR